MAIQLSVAVRNAMGASIEATIGTSAIMKARTGAPPANLAASDTGTVASTLNLPSDWLTAPSSAVISKNGTWSDASADASGTLGHFRIYASDGSTAHVQGTITVTGGGGDMEVDNVSLNAAQAFQVTAFALTIGNA